MRAMRVVSNAVGFDSATHFIEGREPVLVEQLVPKSGIKAFDLAILRRFSRINKVLTHAAQSSPLPRNETGEFGTVVRFDDLGKASFCGDALKDSDHPPRRERRVDLDRQTFSREVIDDSKKPNVASGAQGIVNEVHRPTLVGARRRQCAPVTKITRVALLSLRHLQSGCAVDPVKPFMIHDDVFVPTKQEVQEPVAGAIVAVGNDCAHAFGDRRIVNALKAIARRRSGASD